MLNFGASKPRVKGGARAPGAPPWIRTWATKRTHLIIVVITDWVHGLQIVKCKQTFISDQSYFLMIKLVKKSLILKC